MMIASLREEFQIEYDIPKLVELYGGCHNSISNDERRELIDGLLYNKRYTMKAGEAFLRCLPLDIKDKVQRAYIESACHEELDISID